MRIGVDAATWPNRRGYGRFTRGIVSALARRADVQVTLVADSHTAAAITPPSGVALMSVPTTNAAGEAATDAGRRSVRDMLRLGWMAGRAGFDVFFYPSVYSYFPLVGRTPQVLTIHDAIPEAHPALVFPRRDLRLFWALKMWLARASARQVVTVSPFAARQIERHLGIARERLAALGEAPDCAFHPRPPDAQQAAQRHFGLAARPYVLFVGGVSPHKDLPTAFRALAALRERGIDLDFGIAGDVAGDRFYTRPDELRMLAAELGITDRVKWLGFVPDDDLAALLTGALALVFPSLAEGFGLPVVEAAACGCPVAASDASNAAELIGAGALVFRAGDAAVLAAQLAALHAHPERRCDISARAKAAAAAYSWDAAAGRLLAMLRLAADRS